MTGVSHAGASLPIKTSELPSKEVLEAAVKKNRINDVKKNMSKQAERINFDISSDIKALKIGGSFAGDSSVTMKTISKLQKLMDVFTNNSGNLFSRLDGNSNMDIDDIVKVVTAGMNELCEQTYGTKKVITNVHSSLKQKENLIKEANKLAGNNKIDINNVINDVYESIDIDKLNENISGSINTTFGKLSTSTKKLSDDEKKNLFKELSEKFEKMDSEALMDKDSMKKKYKDFDEKNRSLKQQESETKSEKIKKDNEIKKLNLKIKKGALNEKDKFKLNELKESVLKLGKKHEGITKQIELNQELGQIFKGLSGSDK